MSGSVVSFTTVEYPDEVSMQKAREVFQQEMGQLAEKLRPLGMTKFHSSRLFLPEDRFIIGNWLEYRDMAAYEACDKVWQQSGAEFAEKYGDLFEGVTQASYCVIQRAIEVFYVQKFNRASICLGHADVRLCSAVDHGARPGVWRLAKGCVQDQTKSEVGRIWLSRPTST